MENNSMNNHIYNNTRRDMERNMQGRINNEREMIDRLLRREENGFDCQGNRTDGENANNGNYEERPYCNVCDHKCKNEHGGEVYVTDIGKMACRNKSFRESIWTGRYLQVTLMSICRGDDVGVEMHADTDQYIRVEQGNAVAVVGYDKNCLHNKYKLCAGQAIFIPAGTWHNIINSGRCDLKLSSVYAPPHHPRCTSETYRG